MFSEAPQTRLMGPAVPCGEATTNLAGTSCVHHGAVPASSPTAQPVAQLHKVCHQDPTLCYHSEERQSAHVESPDIDQHYPNSKLLDGRRRSNPPQSLKSSFLVHCFSYKILGVQQNYINWWRPTKAVVSWGDTPHLMPTTTISPPLTHGFSLHKALSQATSVPSLKVMTLRPKQADLLSFSQRWDSQPPAWGFPLPASWSPRVSGRLHRWAWWNLYQQHLPADHGRSCGPELLARQQLPQSPWELTPADQKASRILLHLKKIHLSCFRWRCMGACFVSGGKKNFSEISVQD